MVFRKYCQKAQRRADQRPASSVPTRGKNSKKTVLNQNACSEVPALASPACPLWLAFLLLAVVALVVFSNAMTNTFHLDDLYRIVENGGIRTIWPPTRHFLDAATSAAKETVVVYRPLLPLSLSFDYHFWGLNPVGYHVVNLLLHVGSALLLMLVLAESGAQLQLRRAGAHKAASALQPVPPLLPLAAALFFVIHPVSGVVVNYICARDLALMQLLLLGSLYVYVRSRRRVQSIATWALALLLLGLSLCAKTNALVFPLLILVWEWSIVGTKLLSRAMALSVLPFLLVVVAFTLWSSYGPGAGLTGNVIDTANWPGLSWPFTETRLHLFYYARNFVWPWTMRALPEVAVERAISWEVALGACAIVGSLVLAFRERTRRPLVCFGILAYWVMFLLEGTVIPMHHAASDYRPYAGSGFAFAAALALVVDIAPARWFKLGFALLLLYFGISSFLLNRPWNNEISFWQQSIKYGGEPIAHMNYALSLPDRQDPRVRDNLEIAVKRAPGSALAHLNLGLLLIDLGERQHGFDELKQAAALGSSWGITHHYLAIGYEKLGMPTDAQREHGVAADLDVRNKDYNYSLALAHSNAGHPELALRLLERLLTFYPRDRDVRFLLGYDLLLLKKYQDAQPIFVDLCREFPTVEDFQYDLGYLYARSGRCGEAASIFSQAIVSKAKIYAAQENLKLCQTLSKK